MLAIQNLFSDIISLLFPELCNACGTNLNRGEEQLCIKCQLDLPYTDFHNYPDNRVAKQLWARLPIHAAMAMLYFKKGSKVQNLIHGLKYNGKTEVGIKLGSLLAARLKTSEMYQDIDLIIPVPLHPKKQKSRGYNQSECIAAGVAEGLGIKMDTAHLLRTKSTSSQTKKTRYIRFENMEKVFEVMKPEQLADLHVLLIDDVITTGSTIEACGIALLNAGVKKVSIAAIAFAE